MIVEDFFPVIVIVISVVVVIVVVFFISVITALTDFSEHETRAGLAHKQYVPHR